MSKWLPVLGVLFVAGVAGAENDFWKQAEAGPPSGEVCHQDGNGDTRCIVWAKGEETRYYTEYAPLFCITTEFCGDPEEDSDVRCVRVKICGEPIR